MGLFNLFGGSKKEDDDKEDKKSGKVYSLNPFIYDPPGSDSKNPESSRFIIPRDDGETRITSGSARDPRGDKFVSIEKNGHKVSGLLDKDNNVIEVSSKNKK